MFRNTAKDIASFVLTTDEEGEERGIEVGRDHGRAGVEFTLIHYQSQPYQ